MPRVKKSVKTRARRKKVLDAAKGYRGSRRRLYRIAADTVDRGRKFGYRDRKAKKRTFRALWITRINAAVRSHDLTYGELISGLAKANVEIDRKMLAEVAYRVADIIAYVNHDIDDAVRAGILRESDLPAGPVAVLGATGSARIGRMVTDAVEQTLAGGLSEVRMTDEVLSATLELRSFLFGAVYENAIATAEFSKAEGILGGLWERIRARPQEFLDPVILERDGLDAASRDFLAGMTDRFAVRLYERLFIPRPWIEVGGEPHPIQERL